MKYSEILEKYEIIACRPPQKGELFITRPNHVESDDEWLVIQAGKNFKRLFHNIVIERTK